MSIFEFINNLISVGFQPDNGASAELELYHIDLDFRILFDAQDNGCDYVRFSTPSDVEYPIHQISYDAFFVLFSALSRQIGDHA